MAIGDNIRRIAKEKIFPSTGFVRTVRYQILI